MQDRFEQTGVYHNEATWPNYRFENPPRTFPQLFAQAGYAVANFGKVHVPSGLQVWQYSDPRGGGMREFAALALPEEPPPIRPPGIPVVIGGVFPADHPYPADPVADNALAWIEHADRPFFARLSILQPHTPVLPPARLAQLYADVPFPTDLPDVSGLSRFERRFGAVSQGAKLPEQDRLRAQTAYYALVVWIDEQVGKILSYLRGRNLRESTIVVFDADHGWPRRACIRTAQYRLDKNVRINGLAAAPDMATPFPA